MKKKRECYKPNIHPIHRKFIKIYEEKNPVDSKKKIFCAKKVNTESLDT